MVDCEAKRYNAVNCGRRWGKTKYAMRKLAEKAREGLPVAYLGPIYDDCFDVYTELTMLLEPEIERRAEGRWIKLLNGGFIRFWSMENGADRVRGKKYARVVMDEAAIVTGLKAIWEKVVRATLADYQGDAFFVSTPRRGSHFEVLFDKGQDGEADWASWTQTTYDNPFISDEEIEEMRATMSAETFRSEILAEFEASESDLVFPEVTMTLHARDTIPVLPKDWRAHIIGIDVGGGDPTAITPIALWRDDTPTVARTLPTIKFHQHDEYYQRSTVSTEDLITYCLKMHAIAPLTKILVAETGGNIITNTLAKAFPQGVVERYIKERGGGLETVRWLYQSQRLTIATSCKNSWAEFSGYRWKKNRDMETGERYATSTPHDNHADAHDARRAALQWAVDGLRNGELLALQSGGKQTWGAESLQRRRKTTQQVWAK